MKGKENVKKLDNKTDMKLFEIEQDIKDLEEQMQEKGDTETADKLMKIADKVMALQND
jgi:uncharacterized protein HemX